MNATRDAAAPLSAAKAKLLAELELRNRRKSQAGAIPCEPAARYPLSPAQQRLWFLHRLEGPSAVYNIATGLRLRGAVDVPALQRALQALAARHAVLRSVIVEQDGAAWQLLREDLAPLLRREDLSHLPAAQRDAALAAHKAAESGHAFDLGGECLLRALLLDLDDGESALLLTIHHIVADGWSINVLLRELVEGYQAAVDGVAATFAPLPIQYGDYARWQRGQSELQERDLAYWREALQGAPALLELPADRPRPAQASYRGAVLRTRIDAALRRRAEAFAREHEASLFMLLLAAFGVLLARHSGQDDVVVGTPLANRERAETAGLIGFFVNSLPLRLRPDRRRSFAELLAQARGCALGAFDHQSLPLERLVDELRPARSLAYAPLFQVMFGLNNTAEVPLAVQLPGLDLRIEDMPGSGAKFDLSVSYSDHGGALEGHWEFAADLFDEDAVAALAARYVALLEALLDAPQRPVGEIGFAAAAERAAVAAWSRGARADFGTMHPVARIAAQAAAAPDAIAVVAGDAVLTYAAFERRANQLARELIARGIGAEERVALVLERGLELPVALLAVLKAGACYVPVDPKLPVARRELLIAQSGARHVIDRDNRADWFAAAAAQPGTSPAVALPDEGLVYVIYTSGTTGLPKGVAVQAASLANLAGWHAQAFGVDRATRATQLAGTGFDAMAWEVWPCWMAGACVVLPDAEALLSPELLTAALDEAAVSHCFLPTPVAEASFAALGCLRHLRVLLVGGDRLSPVAALPAQIRLVNNYGPTEATVVATSEEVVVGDARAPSIGRAIANLTAWVLDDALQPLPPGVLGELYVGGAGLARGYLDQPAMTAERFIPDPTSAEAGARLYRTGDLVRWRRDGGLEFVGRADEQVKLRGYRIETGEIENQLLRLPDVAQACVLLRAPAGGERQLVAYVAGAALPPAETLREALRARLPDYMVPALFVALAALPTTVNGKIDRNRLPEPDWSARSGGQVAPEGDREIALAAIWCRLLGLESVGRHDNFFELGGHSLLAARLLDTVREHFGTAPALKQLWTHPTIAELAACLIDAAGSGGDQALPEVVHDAATRHEPFALTDIQQAYWLGRADVFEIGNVAAHAYSEHELSADAFSIAEFEDAFNRLLRRHDMLRMVVDAEGRQRVLADPGRYVVAYRDLAQVDPAAREAELLATREAMSHHVFATDRWPLFDVRVSRLGARDYRLYWSFDGLLLDGYSQQILIGELLTLLAAPQAELPALDITFRDYVRGLEALRETAVYARSRDYWLGRLERFPAGPELPLAVDPSSVRQPQFVRREHRLAAPRWERLKQRARRLELTVSGLLLTAFAEVLARWSKGPRFVLNLTLFNRLPLHPHVDRLLGDFTSLTLLEVAQDLRVDFATRCRRLQQQLWDDIEHRHFSGLDVLRELRRRSGGGNVSMPVVFSSMLDMAGGPAAAEEQGEEARRRGFAVSQTSQVWLDHQVSEDAGELATAWDAVEQLFPAGVLDAMFAAYTGLLERLADEDATWSAREVVPLPPSQSSVRERVNATQAPWSGRLLQQGFEEQAQRTPEALAVWSSTQCLSYRELRMLARHYAHQLRAAGLKPNQLVGVVMHKGWEQVVATLAVLHAGGAYLPIDA
ncbi:MAG: amino acid adenylation domain-containing protein, partial [Xanthomonadaceae bacterium]|nr:amino acid adenylation domain-containing protein [Xanthomonadaceae bacterium]